MIHSFGMNASTAYRLFGVKKSESDDVLKRVERAAEKVGEKGWPIKPLAIRIVDQKLVPGATPVLDHARVYKAAKQIDPEKGIGGLRERFSKKNNEDSSSCD